VGAKWGAPEGAHAAGATQVDYRVHTVNSVANGYPSDDASIPSGQPTAAVGRGGRDLAGPTCASHQLRPLDRSPTVTPADRCRFRIGVPRPTVVVVQVSVGARGEVVAVVTDDDTAVALSSGSLPVLATPRLVAWCEAACCRALATGLAEGTSSVGTGVRLEHLAPSAVGARVTAVAVLTAVDARRLTFDVGVTDAEGAVVARGTLERVVVDDERFLGRLG